MITFKNLPDTTTPINAENLNSNFQTYETKRAYNTTDGTAKWFKILKVPSTGGYSSAEIVFEITTGGYSGSKDIYCKAKLSYYNNDSTAIRAEVLEGNINVSNLGYIKNDDNSVDIYLYTEGEYTNYFVKPVSIYEIDNIWNNNAYPLKIDGTPSLTGNFKFVGDIFLSNETIIGTWVNGKTLYRKCFTINTNIDAGATLTIAHGISNANLVMVKNAYLYNTSNGVVYPLNLTGYAGTFNDKAYVYADRTNIKITANTGWSTGWYKIIILEYTKN